ncbi:MAG: hypothetical protein KAH03_07345 [Cocleimonas sp.]|nr:hypothetical protein [Cocleimonas sp.]
MKKFKRYRHLLVLLSILFSSSACNNSSEVFEEEFTPLSCTIPGELQLGNETKDLLSQYKR